MEERKNRIYLHEAVVKNLEISKAQFLIDKDASLPSKLEARSLLNALKESLAVSTKAAENINQEFLQNLSAKGEPYFHTGMKVDIDIANEGKAVFEVVVDTATGDFRLHGEIDKNGNETVAGQLANSLRLT